MKYKMVKSFVLIFILSLMTSSNTFCQICVLKNDICYYTKDKVLLDSIGYAKMDIRGSVSCTLLNESTLIKSAAHNAIGGCKIWLLSFYKVEDHSFLHQKYYSVKTAFRKDFFIKVEGEFIYFIHENKIKKRIPISVNNLENLDKIYLDFTNEIGVWSDKKNARTRE